MSCSRGPWTLVGTGLAGRRQNLRHSERAVYLGLTIACAISFVACGHGRAGSPYRWDASAAAKYLDRREARWAKWSKASRDHGTFCVSCHTALSYALVRPEIQAPSAEQAGAAEESKLVEDVRKRVRLWGQTGPYYQGMFDESRGTEAVLNALILATYDARNGSLGADTRSAFDHMWLLQKTSGNQAGAWSWLQFRQEPWEAPDSVYYGACLAALAVGTAPDGYRDSAGIQPNLTRLRDYLNQTFAAQTTINQVTLLWASLKWPGLIDATRKRSIVDEVFAKQRPDGGWSLATLIGNWKRTDGTPLVFESDGYATGLITYVLQEAGVPRGDIHLERGLNWLANNQSWWNGHWSAYSLNRRRHDPFSNVSQFMNDAATAYAAMALTQADRPAGGVTAGQMDTDPADFSSPLRPELQRR
jgi:squalene-hopene/tetraprenyl-beta-curcumene cyclase